MESFNGKFRDECLNGHWFLSMGHARHTIEQWRKDYNTVRRHSALGGQDQTAYYTTGNVEAHYLNRDPQVGTGEISVTGQNFSCAAWSTEDGPGQLATGFLVEDDPQAGDTSNANLLDD